jgi:hypothetical protein
MKAVMYCEGHMTKTLVLLLTSLALVPLVARAQSKAALKVGIVTAANQLDGCGCSIYRTHEDDKKNRFLLVSDMDRNAVINLDGKDLKLRAVRW